VDLDELRSVRRTERESSTLQHLRDSFYRDVADYVERRKDDYRRQMAEADDPFAASEEVEHIKDEVETAEDVAEAIYERRVGKVVKMAAFAAADMSADEEGLTAEERELFDDLVARIRQNRETVLATLAGDGPSVSPDDDGAGGDEGAAEQPPGSTVGEAAPDAPVVDAPGGDESGVLSEAMGGAGGAGGTDGLPDGGDGPRPEPSGPTPADASTSGPADASADAAGVGDGPDPTGGGPASGGEPVDGPIGAGGERSRTGAGPDAREDPSPPGEAPIPTPDGSGAAGSPTGAGTETAGAGSDADGASLAGSTDRVTVRLTSDVGSIFGVDEREYDLASEDVVTLPTTNAQPLLDRGAAERLDGG
jgi:DNA replication factor GINS